MKTLSINNGKAVTCPNHINPTRRIKETKAVVYVTAGGVQSGYGLTSEADAREFVAHQIASGNEAHIAKIY